MIILQGPHPAGLAPGCGNPPGRGQSSRQGGDVGYLVFNGILANVGIIMQAQLAAGGVDDELDVPVLNDINDLLNAKTIVNWGKD